MVPGKNAAQCQSRARDEDFIKAHLYSGEEKGTSASEPSLGSVIRDGDTDARLAELIIALPGGTTRRWRAIAREMGGGWSADDCLRRAASLARSASTASEKWKDAPGAARMAQPEPDLDEKGEFVVLSGAEDDTFNGKYFRSHAEDRKPWEVETNDLICYRHTSNESTNTCLWRFPLGQWGCAFESSFNERGNRSECKLEILSIEKGHVNPAQVQLWFTQEWLWDPEVQSQVPKWARNGSIKVEVASSWQDC
jgi:hypothetical protein